MKACGVIAEYNPFHLGHAYQLQEAKRLSQAECMVVVMSGNFLQRGEPALVDKWQRAAMALNGGADIVVELPVAFSTQAADLFAKGSVQLLKELQVSDISFGSETGTSEEFVEAAKLFIDNEETIHDYLQKKAAEEKSFASNMEEAIHEMIPTFPLSLNQPNIQLGFTYVKELIRQQANIGVKVVPRVGAGYHDLYRDDVQYQSATAIRQKILNSENIADSVPDFTLRYLERQRKKVTWETFWPLFQYQVTISSTEDLKQIYQMEEGLEYRIKEVVQHAGSFEECIRQIKSKRISWVKAQRICLYVLLQLKEQQMKEELANVRGIRVLGFTDKGQHYLSEIKEHVTIPLLANINQKNHEKWALDSRAGEIYRLSDFVNSKKQDFTRKPIKNIDIDGIH